MPQLVLRTGLRLLICSDGLTKELGDERIRLHLAAGMPADETAGALVDAALAAGGRDNVTVAVVDVTAAPDRTSPDGGPPDLGERRPAPVQGSTARSVDAVCLE